MKAVMLEPGREARALDIPHTLKAMQQAVGGTIQAIYPWKGVSAALGHHTLHRFQQRLLRE